ncbi:MAG: rhodanese-like domain-containing protein [Flavobacteriales bacterium]|nr:rhodanese-like domain-containing protein [Flavobacteriales bacterium]
MRTIAILLSLALATAAFAQNELTPAQFKEAIAKGDAVLVDVRTPTEYASGHIDGSINVDWTAKEYEAAFAQLDPKKPVLLYCHGGGRSEQALEYLESKGYKARHLGGGITAWKKAGLPTVK